MWHLAKNFFWQVILFPFSDHSLSGSSNPFLVSYLTLCPYPDKETVSKTKSFDLRYKGLLRAQASRGILLRLYLRTSTPVTPVTPDCQVRTRAIPIIRTLPEYPVPGRTLVRRSAYCYFLTLVTRSILQLVIVLSFYYCFIITIRTQVYKLRTLYCIPQFKYQLGLSLNSSYSPDHSESVRTSSLPLSSTSLIQGPLRRSGGIVNSSTKVLSLLCVLQTLVLGPSGPTLYLDLYSGSTILT